MIDKDNQGKISI